MVEVHPVTRGHRLSALSDHIQPRRLALGIGELLRDPDDRSHEVTAALQAALIGLAIRLLC